MLNNKSIINVINTVCNTYPYVADPREVFQAALHCFYFMPSSKARDAFVSDLDHIFLDTLEDAKAVKSRTNATMRDSMIYAATRRLLIQMTEFFDKEHFVSCAEKLDQGAQYNKEFIGKQLRTFSKEQLLIYFTIVGGLNDQGNYFISKEAFYNMWKELNEECTKVDPSVPDMRESIFDADFEADFDKLKDIYIVCPETGEVRTEGVDNLYFFEYLSTDTIVEIFEKHVDGNMEMLSFLSAALCAADFKIALKLTEAMLAFALHYSVYALDMAKYPQLESDISDEYLNFFSGMYEAIRTNRRKNN